jgi:hypothetical protein
LAVSLLVWARPSGAKLDEDELYWIGSAYYFHLWRNGEWGHPDWALLPARENPPLAKYVIGAGLGVAGRSVPTPDVVGSFYLMFEKVPHAWGSGEAYAKRAAVVDRMTPAARDRARSGAGLRIDTNLFIIGRRTMVVVAATLAFIVFIACVRVSAPFCGVMASTLLVNHPAVIYAYNHALSDIVALLFSATAVAVFSCFAERLSSPSPTWRRSVFSIAAVGASALGLACAAKMNSLVVAILALAVVAYCFLATRTSPPERKTAFAWAGVILLGGSVIVFAAINPAILRDPVGGMLATVREHQLTEAIQAKFLPDHLTGITAKLRAVGELTNLTVPGLMVLTMGSLAALAWRNVHIRLVSVWYLIALACVTAWIPFPRSRYVLPVVLPAMVLIAVALHLLATVVVAKLRSRANTSVIPAHPGG